MSFGPPAGLTKIELALRRATALFFVFVFAKAFILGGETFSSTPARGLGSLWEDLAVALAFFLITLPASRSIAPPVLFGLLVGSTAIHVSITRLFGTPLTWSMMKATRGPLSDSIVHAIRLDSVFFTTAMLLLGWGLYALFLKAQLVRKRTVLIIVATSTIASALTWFARTQGDWSTENPLMALMRSTQSRVEPAFANRDWRASDLEIPETGLEQWRGAAAGRNIVMVSLESTGANYLKMFGGDLDLMPNLAALSHDGILFSRAYSVYPESIKGLFSVLLSRYPALDIPAERYEHFTAIAFPQCLRTAGYKTALFHSGRFAYLGMDAIIANRGFDLLEDAGNISGKLHSSFGVEEAATVRRILKWIDAPRGREKFCVFYLPIAGHHPYETPAPGPFPETTDLNRYRNALLYADSALGELLRGLQQRGLFEKTLFMIYGDHGEAFGQHANNFGHTFRLYEENVHVPLLIAAPGLFRQSIVSNRAASLLDLAPTLLDFLGREIAPSFQGTTLLDGRGRRVLFETDYGAGLAGLRDGNWKFIYDLDSKRAELFDLSHDPSEQKNLASAHVRLVGDYRKTLLAWLGAQKALVISNLEQKQQQPVITWKTASRRDGIDHKER